MVGKRGFRAVLRGGAQIGTVLLAGVAGCAAPNRLHAQQPFAPPSQRDMTLIASQASYSVAGEQTVCLLEFPLPMARDGPRAFVVYFTSPGRFGTIPVDRTDPAAAQGFLIQELGHLAGRADFASGTVTWESVWLQPQRRLILDVTCADGARLVGEFDVPAAPQVVRAFEQSHAGDVLLLSGVEPEPSTAAASSTPTTERPQLSAE